MSLSFVLEQSEILLPIHSVFTCHRGGFFVVVN